MACCLRTVIRSTKTCRPSPEYRVVPNSGHFAFIVPCPAEAAKALPEVCVDAGGFNLARPSTRNSMPLW